MSPEIAFGLGAAVLLAALVYGVSRYRIRNPRNQAMSDAATKAQYDRPGSYRPDAYREKLEPEERGK